MFDDDQEVYIPTPAEITEACAEIQSRWTPQQRYQRAGWASEDCDEDEFESDEIGAEGMWRDEWQHHI